ncbi:Reticulon-domain-containing protein [Colletotrichum cereale]|nr:Reticulon-domain-containing protein [Colletotrichum cereale]
MGEPTVVILHNEGGEHSSEDAAQITSTIQRALHERSHPTPEQDGPLKQVLANQDSLYKYISWEEPLRTLGTYLGCLSILFGAHYLPLTRWVLKAAMTTLGVVSVTEFASRSFSSDSLSTRLRPKEYKTFNEATLNATLRDIHDLVQSGAIQAQKILYGQDLEKAFGAFIGVTALYALAQVVAPFWLAVMALTSIFIAPLVNSPQGRKVAQDASARAQDLANTTAEKSKDLAKNGQAMASELGSKAQQAAYDAGNTVSNTAQNGKQAAADLTSRARGTASDLSGAAAEKARNAGTGLSNAAQNGKQTAVDMASKAKGTASDLSGSAADTARNAGQKAQGTASDLSGAVADNTRNAGAKVSNASSQATDKASNASGYAADNVKSLPQTGSNAVNNAQGILSSVFGDAKRNSSDSTNQNYTHDSTYNSFHTGDRNYGGDFPRGQAEYETEGLASRASHSTHVGAEPPRLSAADDVNRRAV